MRTKTESSVRPRTPINGHRDILRVDGIPANLHPCWVNDYNIERFLDAGYYYWNPADAVTVGDKQVNSATPLGDRVQKAVGNGVTAFLMVIPTELYNEDVESIHKEIDEKEAALFRQMKNGEGRYGDIKVDHGSKKS